MIDRFYILICDDMYKYIYCVYIHYNDIIMVTLSLIRHSISTLGYYIKKFIKSTKNASASISMDKIESTIRLEKHRTGILKSTSYCRVTTFFFRHDINNNTSP